MKPCFEIKIAFLKRCDHKSGIEIKQNTKAFEYEENSCSFCEEVFKKEKNAKSPSC